MRLTEIDLQCEDIMWFGIDSQNHIFECTSAGRGNVPEFVCQSRENIEELLDYFMNELETFTQANLLVEYVDTNQLLKDCIRLSSKGLYCFDICDTNAQQYVKIAEPMESLNYEQLPPRIQNILVGNRVDFNIMAEQRLTVEHAY